MRQDPEIPWQALKQAICGSELRVGGVPTDGGGLLAMNHSHVNEGMACKGGAPVHVVLGADVFDSRAAVIDYGSSSLFLKMAP